MRQNIILLAIAVFFSTGIYAQNTRRDLSSMNFLTIIPDARSAGAAHTGLAAAPGMYAHYHNPAQYTFPAGEQAGVAAFFSPWLRNSGIKDMGIYALSGYYKLDSLQSVSASLRYFSMGKITNMTPEGFAAGAYTAYEMAADIAYARRLGRNFGIAVALRYAYSKPVVPGAGGEVDYKAGQALSADLSLYYHRPVTLGAIPSLLTLGLAINNIGTKVSYGGLESYFLPAQLQTGAGLEMNPALKHRFSVTAVLRDYMIPSKVEDSNKSSIAGMLASFSGGLMLQGGCGVEYTYNNMVGARAGYAFENVAAGDRQYITFGISGMYKNLRLDIAYFQSVSGVENPMSNTIQVSLTAGFPWKK